jgi:transcription antitermination factor NusG
MTHAEMECWYAAQVTHQHEKRVARLLEYEGYTQFLPMYKVRRKWSDRIKTIELPLFPGYVFFQSRPSSLGLRLGIQSMCRVVSFGGKPQPIPHEEMAAVQKVIHSKREVCSFPYLPIGSKVRVTDGPLAGITGFIAQIQNHKRLIISVDLINRSMSVGVEPSEVAPVVNCEQPVMES